jgi:hypothetical protein
VTHRDGGADVAQQEDRIEGREKQKKTLLGGERASSITW